MVWDGAPERVSVPSISKVLKWPQPLAKKLEVELEVQEDEEAWWCGVTG